MQSVLLLLTTHYLQSSPVQTRVVLFIVINFILYALITAHLSIFIHYHKERGTYFVIGKTIFSLTTHQTFFTNNCEQKYFSEQRQK